MQAQVRWEPNTPAPQQAPAWQVSTWFNVDQPLSLEAVRGRVVLLHAFQMLCPGCVARAVPQAQRVRVAFPDVLVVGLHTVFEHHAVMGPPALEAFMHEYRITHPVGVDLPSGEGVPVTMAAYGMRGTPTTVLIDRNGVRRGQHFGELQDLVLGAELAVLLGERPEESATTQAAERKQGPSAPAACGDTECHVHK